MINSWAKLMVNSRLLLKSVRLDIARSYKLRNLEGGFGKSDTDPTKRQDMTTIDNDPQTPYLSQDLLDAERQSFRQQKSARQQNRTLPKNVTVDEEIVFGISSIDLALEARRRTFHRLFVKRSKSDQENVRLLDIESRARQLNLPVQRVDVRTLDILADGRPHQGACLDASPLQFENEETLSFDLKESKTAESRLTRDAKQLWILLDRIQDPMNMGAVLRSSFYFGVDRVLAVKRNTCRLTPTVSKASSGTAEILKIYQIEDVSSFLKLKVCEGWSVVGTTSPDAVSSLGKERFRVANLNDFTWPEKSILLIGNEGEGVAREFLQICSDLVSVPLKERSNKNILSLNVSVATGVLLYSHFVQSSQQ